MTLPLFLGRREALAAAGAGLVASVGGCLGGPSFPDADVVAGPEGRDVFEPAVLPVSTGDTVTWGFGSSGHNVSCRPDHSEEAALPDGAEAFASYGPSVSPGSTVTQGETYEHTFEVPGAYVYVCVPHATRGMVGTVRVE